MSPNSWDLSSTTFNMNRYLSKIASELQEHQRGGLSKLDEAEGVLLHHSTGSGKTRTFLEAVSRAHKADPEARALIVAPASLVSNVDKEIAKHELYIDRNRLDALSYEKATRQADVLAQNKYAVAIADEAHRLRNTDTERFKRVGELLQKADKRLLATATANYNHLADIAPLLNLAAGADVMPVDRKVVENRYVEKVKTTPGFLKRLFGAKPEEFERLKNSDELRALLKQYVHYYDSAEDPEVLKKFPSKTERVIEVEMSPEQRRMYQFVEGDIPAVLRMKIRNNMPLDKKEMANLNAFATGVRQVSTGYRYLDKDRRGGYTPKIQQAVDSLQRKASNNGSFRSLVYSNFLDSGVREYSRLLADKEIPHQVYTGSLSSKEKDEIVKRYNSGETPVLLISSSGAEGLDLKGTRLIQVLDPHFNPSKIKQIIGRGVRYESHEHLPADLRHVEVEHYLSVHPKPTFGTRPTSIDKYLHENSGDKQAVFDQIKKLMKESS